MEFTMLVDLSSRSDEGLMERGTRAHTTEAVIHLRDLLVIGVEFQSS
jgi:hypothetical protein